MTKIAYVKRQPKDGDVVLLCRHAVVDKPGTSHWFKIPDEEVFEAQRPDGTKVRGNWIVTCEECFKKMMFDGKDPEINRDMVYKGEALGPLIKELPKA